MGLLLGKTAVITGGGRAVLSDGGCGSIGYGIAVAYAKEGANLVVTGRNVKKLEDAKEELERLYGVNVLPVQADVSKDGDNEKVVRNVVDRAVETFGGIDVLINNAQASASGITLADHTTEQFDLAVYSGLYATFYYMKACYPYLKKSKGTVINFASGAGLFGNFFGDAVHSLGAPRKVVRCPKCGSSFNDIVREGRVGCAECYKVFYNELKPSLQRIHGQIHHSGKIASTAEPVSEEEAKIDEKEELKKQMDEAVAAQNFELAAQLRDRIKELEGGNKNE